MEPNNSRNIIDDIVLSEIQKLLNVYGVSKNKVYECYNAIRYQIEARAVLLNRVPDRNNELVGYYGQYLSDIAEAHGIKYVHSKTETPEVPVQEQPITLEYINENLKLNLTQEQYDKIAILDHAYFNCKAYGILRILKVLNII